MRPIYHFSVPDASGSNVKAQIIDTHKIKNSRHTFSKGTVLLVFDYAFGEQAYELMDELLKTKVGAIKIDIDYG